VVYGDWRGLPHGAAYTRWGTPMVAEMLFSSRNGWLSTTPIAYAGMIGLFLLPRRSRLVAAGLLGAVLVQVYLNSIIFDWWAQASFGQRRMCSVTLPMVVGLAALLAAGGRLAARWRRVPPLVWHVLTAAVLAWFVAWNLAKVWMLRGGRPANTGAAPSWSAGLAAPMRAVAGPIYRAIGNPFALPASAEWAWRHGVPIARWESAVGDYPIVPGAGALADGTWRQARGTWNIGGPGGDVYVVRGLSPSLRGTRAFRWTTAARAEVMVPNLMPYGQRVAVWLAPGAARRVRLRWNGEVVADAELADGWSQVRFDVPDIDVGSNLLGIDAEPGPVPPGPLPAPAGAAGVAVGAVELSFL